MDRWKCKPWYAKLFWLNANSIWYICLNELTLIYCRLLAYTLQNDKKKRQSNTVMVMFAWQTCWCQKPWHPAGQILTLYMLNFQREQKHIFTFYVIPPHWHNTSSWNPSLSKTRTYLFYIVNIMAADVLVTEGARASATMILTQLYWDNSVIAR